MRKPFKLRLKYGIHQAEISKQEVNFVTGKSILCSDHIQDREETKMNYLMRNTVAPAALAMVLSAGAASATTVSFGNFVSSNGADKLSPIVTVDDSPVGSFLISVSLTPGTFEGSMTALFFDLGGQSVARTDVTNVMSGGTTYTEEPDANNVNNDMYQFGTDFGVGGNANNLNGVPGNGAFSVSFGLGFNQQDGVARQPDTLTFNLDDTGLTLDDFARVGMRFRDTTNNAGSDKLIGSVVSTPSPIPLPAAGWLLIAGLGGLGAARLRKA